MHQSGSTMCHVILDHEISNPFSNISQIICGKSVGFFSLVWFQIQNFCMLNMSEIVFMCNMDDKWQLQNSEINFIYKGQLIISQDARVQTVLSYFYGLIVVELSMLEISFKLTNVQTCNTLAQFISSHPSKVLLLCPMQNILERQINK